MIKIIRVGHRILRDARLTTHICLVARAFGADSCVIFGENDLSLEKSMNRINEQWGGNFEISFENLDNLKEYLINLKKNFTIIHLTMYGERIENINFKNKKFKKNLAIIVGSTKVPGDIYNISDFNVSITSQPHSEVSSLSIFLDRLYDGKELFFNFEKEKFFCSSKIFLKESKKSKKYIKKKGIENENN